MKARPPLCNCTYLLASPLPLRSARLAPSREQQVKLRTSCRAMFLAGGTKLVLNLSVPDGGEDTSVDEPESIPLSRTLGLEVPPKPALGRRLKSADLGLDVAPGIVLVRGGPLR